MARAAVSEKECGAEDEEQRCLLELGIFHMRRFDASRDVDHFDHAVVHFQAADALARKLLVRSNVSGAPERVAESREVCAQAAYNLGDAVRSAGAYKSAQALFREAAPNLAEASMRFDCLEALGDVSLEREDHDEAASAFTKALDVLPDARQLWQAMYGAEDSEEVDTLREWPEGRLLWKLAQAQLEKAAAEGDADAAAARETLGQLVEAGEGRCSIRVVARAINLLQPIFREVMQHVSGADSPIYELSSESEGEQQVEDEQVEGEAEAEVVRMASARVPAAVLQNGSASWSSAAARSDRRLWLQKKLGVAPRKVPTEEAPPLPPAVMPTESVVISTSSRRRAPRVRIDVVPPEEWTHLPQWMRDLWRRTFDSAQSGIPFDPFEDLGSLWLEEEEEEEGRTTAVPATGAAAAGAAAAGAEALPAAEPFAVGCTVCVAARVGPGSNKPGGVAIVLDHCLSADTFTVKSDPPPPAPSLPSALTELPSSPREGLSAVCLSNIYMFRYSVQGGTESKLPRSLLTALDDSTALKRQ